jgi:hypothetical protein
MLNKGTIWHAIYSDNLPLYDGDHSNFEFKYITEHETEFENMLGYEWRA